MIYEEMFCKLLQYNNNKYLCVANGIVGFYFLGYHACTFKIYLQHHRQNINLKNGIDLESNRIEI